ncbi:MAG: acyl-CoA dehydrogenase [Frankiales bacterium]|jgi:alkylation response protein AidB-like acyl-CoA dehydrogenase|nr:acyl-CoA dehydrogenase [Frankiales bacterium]
MSEYVADIAGTREAQSLEHVEDFAHRVEAWLDTCEIPVAPLDLDERIPVLRAWQAKLFDAGFVGVDWPEEYGGQGLTLLHARALTQALVAHRAPFPVNRVALEVIGPTIITFASKELCSLVLPGMLSGDEVWSIGLSEPGIGSDLGNAKTRAVLDGDTYVVNGQKVWSSFASYGTWCAALVRTDASTPGPRGLSNLAIRLDAPGVTVRPISQMTGDREFCEIFFSDVRVPASQLIGAEGSGWEVVSHSLGGERGLLSMRRHAELENTLADLVEELEPAGLLNSDNQLAALGSMDVGLRVLGAQLERTAARLLDNGGKPTPIDSADKWTLSLIEQDMFQKVLQLLGPGRSWPDATKGVDGQRWLHDYLYSRAAPIYSGTDQIQANIIGERLLGLPVEPRGDGHVR